MEFSYSVLDAFADDDLGGATIVGSDRSRVFFGSSTLENKLVEFTATLDYCEVAVGTDIVVGVDYSDEESNDPDFTDLEAVLATEPTCGEFIFRWVQENSGRLFELWLGKVEAWKYVGIDVAASCTAVRACCRYLPSLALLRSSLHAYRGLTPNCSASNLCLR